MKRPNGFLTHKLQTAPDDSKPKSKRWFGQVYSTHEPYRSHQAKYLSQIKPLVKEYNKFTQNDLENKNECKRQKLSHDFLSELNKIIIKIHF